MPTITRQQLARWMNGEISDPQEIARIADAVERDPEVGRWFDLMDLDRFVEDEDAEPLPPELAREAESIFSACSRSVLFPMKFADRSWGKTLRAAGEVAGQLTRWVPGGKEVLELRLRQIAEQPLTYRMDIKSWPEGYEPVCVVLAHLRYSRLQPARYPGMGVTGLAAETDDEETVSIPFPEALTRAPQTAEYALGAATDEEGTPEAQPIEIESADIHGKLNLSLLSLQIEGAIPEERLTDCVVAELQIKDNTGRWHEQRRLIRLERTKAGEPARGAAQFRQPDFGVGQDVQLAIRPLADEDVYLLAPDDANDVLADAEDMVTLPVEQKEDGLEFQVRWPDQERLLADAGAGWFLQVAEPREES